MSDLAIVTSQNVEIHFELATVGKRVLAFFIDLIIKLCYSITASSIVVSSKFIEKLGNLDSWSISAIWILIMSPILVYSVLTETLFHGQTIGKRITKIKVIKLEGCEAGFPDYFTRWIFLIIDLYVGLGIFGLISALFSKDVQRIGDLATGTAVISLEKKWNINHTIFDEVDKDYSPVYPEVRLLSDADMHIVKRVLKHYNINKNMSLIFKLTKKLESTLKVKKKEKKSLDFVNRLVKDFNYYTQEI